MTTQPDYASRVPQFTFPDDQAAQEAALATNPLLARFATSRAALAADRHRPLYHYVNPESTLNDPNGLCFWRGQWHLFYQAYPPEDPRQHWGHAVSDDLIHWRDLPYAIYPHPEECCFSGTTLVEENRVIAIYHGTKAGNMIATASDDLLLNWDKLTGQPVIPLNRPDGDSRPHNVTSSDDSTPQPYNVFDPCLWREGDWYYALSAGTLRHGPSGQHIAADFLFRSTDLINWEYLHPFIEGDRMTLLGDDGACPYFWPIGDRHMLLFFSHMSGGQALIGDYDTARAKFVASAQVNFNHGAVAPGGLHAPSATPDGDGGIIVIFNMNPAKPAAGWDQIMTLPRRLTLTGPETLHIEPVAAVASLRGAGQSFTDLHLPANTEIPLDSVHGDALELALTIAPSAAPLIELNVLCAPDKQEYTRIAFYRERGYRSSVRDNRTENPERRPAADSIITVDTSYSSTLPDVRSRPPESAPVYLAPDEPLELRVFVDRSVVEVFVNGRQAVAVRVYPGRDDSTGVSLRSQAHDSTVTRLEAWPMASIYAG